METIKLSSVTTKVGSGATPRGGKNAYKDSGIPLIRSQNVLDLSFNYDTAFIDDDQAEKLSNVIVEKDDVLLNITGDSVARVCIVPDDILPARVNQHVALIRVDPAAYDANYLLYYLQAIKPHLLSISEIGGTRRAITKGMIEELDLPDVELSKQQAVAHTLSLLDQKINLLHRQNQTLEALGAAVFREWFSKNDDLEVVEMSDVASVLIGRTPPRKESQWFSTSKENMKWISIKDMARPGSFSNDSAETLTDDAIEKFRIPVIPKGTVMLSFKMTLGRVKITTEPMVSNEAIAHFNLNGSVPISSQYLYYYLLTFPYQILGSTSSIVTSINTKMIKNLPILIPDESTSERFDNIVEPLFEKIYLNQKQITVLENLRDLLLPKLMSGQVTVRP